jgi:hypothetical protein
VWSGSSGDDGTPTTIGDEGDAVATGSKSRDERERARVYQARVALHEAQVRRRSRDNLLAGIIGGVLILAVIGGQTAYFAMGPGAPAPEPSGTPSSTVTPDPTATAPVPTPTPTP